MDTTSAGQAPDLTMPTGLSPSSLDLWDQCRKRFFEEKIARRDPGSSGLPALTGTFVHLVLEHLMKLPPGQRTIAAARAIATEQWTEFSSSQEWSGFVAETGFSDTKPFRQSVWGSIVTYFTVERPDRVDVVATERYIEAVFKGVKVRGFIDRLERDAFDDLVVTDYKNGKVPPPWFREPKFRQITTYGALVREEMGELPVTGRLLYTAHGEVLTTEITDETADAVVERYVEAWGEIETSFETSTFDPKPGNLCGWCPFIGECPEGQQAVQARFDAGKDPGPGWDVMQAMTTQEDGDGPADSTEG